MRNGEANVLRAVRKFFALLKQPQSAPDEVHRRHLAWDRACRARGMTAREQADELQLRCAWLRLRRKASAKVLKNPKRFRDILDRVAMDEAKTLRAIGGAPLADAFVRAYEAAEAMEILEDEAAFVVRVETNGALVKIDDAPSIVPHLPRQKPVNRKARQRPRATAS
jgi:hypothetical protein